MPLYYFHLRTPCHRRAEEKACHLPGLPDAFAEAHRLGFDILRRRVGREPARLSGCLDIEDERRRPVGRILLAELMREIS